MSEKLKPCPFCGAIPIIEYEPWPDISPTCGIYRLSAKHDDSCFIRQMNGMNRIGVMSSSNEDFLITTWNRRAENIDR